MPPRIVEGRRRQSKAIQKNLTYFIKAEVVSTIIRIRIIFIFPFTEICFQPMRLIEKENNYIDVTPSQYIQD